MSVNTFHVRTLIAAQLRLDLRHPKTGEMRASRAVLTFLSYALSSVVLTLALAERGASTAELLFVGNSFAAVLAAFGIAGSYDDLMGRPREHAQTFALPASEHTLYAARLANILLFGGVMASSAALPLALFAGWQHGLAAVLAVGGSMFVTMLVVSMVALAGIWVLLLQAPLRLQRPVLSAVRAGLIAALVLGYQVVATQQTLIADTPWWVASWMLAVVEYGSPSAILTLVGTALALAALFGVFFPTRYVRLLERTASAETARHSGGLRTAAPNRLEALLTRGPAARAGFGLAGGALSADRLVRGRVWPVALLATVFGVFGWWSGGLGDLFVHGVSAVLVDPAVHMHLSVLTMLLFASQAAMQGVQVSDHPEGAWIFDALPLRSHRAVQIGAQQAVLFRVILPLHVVLALLLALSMPLLHALLHAAFWFAGCAVITRVQALTQRQAPLSRRSDRFSAGERFLPLLLAVPAALALLTLQSLTFSTQLSALLLVLGLLLFHSALGRIESLKRSRMPAVLRPAAERLRPSPVAARG